MSFLILEFIIVSLSRQPKNSHIPGISIFVQILILLNIQNCRNLNEILHISGNIGSTKKAKPILEMPGLGVFCDYYL